MVRKRDALHELRAHLSFSQLRFHCGKQQGRTFHVTTVANSSGEAVVQYFSGQTNVQPASCGLFVRMKDDNSELAVNCDQWGYDGSPHVGKWAHGDWTDYPAFIIDKHQWRVVGDEWSCDDNNNIQFSLGDFWKIYAR